jgi:hypothetical protein
MNRPSPHSSAERSGRRLGRVWRRLLRFQSACHRGLIRVGLPVVGANLVIAAVWVLIVAALVRYGLWVGIVAGLVLVLVSLGTTDVPNSVEREYNWRMGYMGFGLYNSDGFRVDPHDPDKTF